MLSTMQDFPLTIAHILRHGQTVHGRSVVTTFEGDATRAATFSQIAERAERLAAALRRLGIEAGHPGGTLFRHHPQPHEADLAVAAALRRLGIEAGDRVGTFCWNHQEHQEAYLAVPAMGAVLHTLNIRLFPEQLAYVINHAEDRVVIVDDSLIPLLARVVAELKTVEHYIVIGSGDASALGGDVLRYDDLLAAEEPEFAWPDVDERSAAAMCYTSGTTGNPKGVVYSHRST